MWNITAENKKESMFEDGTYTFIGKGVDFKGKARFDGSVRIDGHFDGHITAEETIIIGEHAVIKGEILCGIIISKGKIEGNITASQNIQLLKPAVMVGDIHTPSFSMEEGVLFNGRCDMGINGLDALASQSAAGATGESAPPQHSQTPVQSPAQSDDGRHVHHVNYQYAENTTRDPGKPTPSW